MPETSIRRRTLHVGDNLNAMIESGRVRGDSVSQRVDRLAARYATIVAGLAPKRWLVEDWLTIIGIVRELSFAGPSDAATLATRLKQIGKLASGADGGALMYRVESLKLHEQWAVVDVAERAIAAGATQADSLAAWLVEHDIQA